MKKTGNVIDTYLNEEDIGSRNLTFSPVAWAVNTISTLTGVVKKLSQNAGSIRLICYINTILSFTTVLNEIFKYLCGTIVNFGVPNSNYYSCSIYREIVFRNVPHSQLDRVSGGAVVSSVDVPACDSSFPISFSSVFCRFLTTLKCEVVDSTVFVRFTFVPGVFFDQYETVYCSNM
jgi:hypothetical protein